MSLRAFPYGLLASMRYRLTESLGANQRAQRRDRTNVCMCHLDHLLQLPWAHIQRVPPTEAARSEMIYHRFVGLRRDGRFQGHHRGRNRAVRSIIGATDGFLSIYWFRLSSMSRRWKASACVALVCGCGRVDRGRFQSLSGVAAFATQPCRMFIRAAIRIVAKLEKVSETA
jgi:hypothetical protein